MQIDKDIKKDILNKLNNTIDNYLSMNISIKHLKKYFKSNIAFNSLISDINFIGEEQFDTQVEYKNFIKKLLLDILSDRDAYEKDNKNFKNVKSFENFITKKI